MLVLRPLEVIACLAYVWFSHDVVRFSNVGQSEISGGLADLVANVLRLNEVHAGNLFLRKVGLYWRRTVLETISFSSFLEQYCSEKVSRVSAFPLLLP